MITLEELYKKLKIRLMFDVEVACELFGGSVVSSGRSILRNLAVNGSKTSWHLDWMAFDVVLDPIDTSEAFIEYLQHRGYLVLKTGSLYRESNRQFHIQYAWPVIKNFIRKNRLSHLKEIVNQMPRLFTDYGEIDSNERG